MLWKKDRNQFRPIPRSFRMKGVCLEEEKKRILKSCHGEQLGVTLGGIKPQSNVSNVTHGVTIGV